ncbi:nucleophosmin [Abrus precatorius]|uniref:Nucleophosmin n=1 Tax=Abrus precatorius TaxID=3816 RepID=A0A8B8LVY3_ABRPR|nr:nucleophosmin [Abrus precatorius]
MKVVFWVVVVSVVVAAWMPLSHCSKKPVGMARKEDIPYIKCQVCEKLAKELYQQVQNKQSEIAPKKISEYQIIEIAENVCNLKKVEADWILRIDIVEKGDRLELVEQDSEGQCNSECKTIERACQEVIGYSDTDVAEYLYSSKPDVDSLLSYLCKDLTKACSTKPPPVPKDRTPGEPFVAKSSKEAEMEKLLKSMEGMPGAPGMKMYSRDDLMNMKNFGDEDADDEDEEDDDDEASFPSKLGKVLRAEESGKKDWKQMIKKGIEDTSMTLKKHANKVSNHIRQWWRGKTTTSKKGPKAGKTEL